MNSRLKNLVKNANLIIEKAVKEYGDDLAISCSFGKDSMVILDLAVKIKPDILVVWNNTLIENPETVKFAKDIVKEWELNFIEMRPFVTFWDIVEEFGLPTTNNRKCCDFLKLYPVKFLFGELGIKATLTGLRRDESFLRRNITSEGPDTQLDKMYRYNPIFDWTELDVLEYHIDTNLPMNNLYMNGFKRTGCMYCTLGANFGGLKVIRDKYPKGWKRLYKLLKEDDQFIENKDGTFRTTKNFKKKRHTEKYLKDKASEGFIKRMKNGEVFRIGKGFNRTLRLPCKSFV